MTKPANPPAIPDWFQVNLKIEAGDTTTALERFVYDNEPADRKQAIEFRKGLRDMLAEREKTNE